MPSAAERRLAALLRDEEYGPKLVRLNRTDERTILDLIDANRGREARNELDRLDWARRTHRTNRETAASYARLPKAQRKAEWRNIKKRKKDRNEAEFWKLYKSAVLQ